jgi:Copper transport outer membrane protein, MctB
VIDFRYHLVSIIAIFLALAVGIVLGTTTLNGTALHNIQSQVKRLSSDKTAQRQQIDALHAQVKDAESFIGATEPTLTANALNGQRVAVITAPETPGNIRTSLLTSLQHAGAVVTNDIRLSSAFTDPKQSAALDDLATRLVVPGSLPAKATGASLAAAELAQVLVTKPGAKPAGQDAISTTLAGFQQGSFLTVAGTPGGPASLAVVLVPPAPRTPTDGTKQAGQLMSDLAASFGSRAAATLVAGPAAAAAPGGMLSIVRQDRAATRVASSVDTLEAPAGRVAAVLALRGALSGRLGAYGFGTGASGPLPASPSPTPTATPSTTAR